MVQTIGREQNSKISRTRKKHDVNFSKLTNQIEALKSDLLRFKTETNEQMKPLLSPPISLKELFNQTIPILSDSLEDLDSRAEMPEYITPPPISLKQLFYETIPNLSHSLGDLELQGVGLDQDCCEIRRGLHDLYEDVERLKGVCHPSGIGKQGSSMISQTGAFEQGRGAGTRKKNKLCET